MDATDYYDLPMLVGEHYMLASILRETSDTILYRGTQRELRREVVVEALRKSAAKDPRQVRLFLDSAKAQAGFVDARVSRVLEAMHVNDTWMVVRENPPGDPLDMTLNDGKRLPALDVCRLMILLCKLCLRLDAEHIASSRFLLEDIFYYAHDFCIMNPVRAGERAASSSRLYLTSAAREIVSLPDAESPLSSTLTAILRRMSNQRGDSPLTPALYLAELSRLYTLMIGAK